MIQFSKKWLLLIIVPCLLVPFIIITQRAPDAKKTDNIVLVKAENKIDLSENSRDQQRKIQTQLVPMRTAESKTQKQPHKNKQSSPQIEHPIKLVSHTAPRVQQPQAQRQQRAPQIQHPNRLVRTDVPTPAEQRQVDSALKRITLKADWDKNTLAYKHWTGRYRPSSWVLKLNGKVVLTYNGREYEFKTKHLEIDPTKILKAHFDWEFLNGRRKGWKEIDYKVNQNADKLELAFDWKNEPWQLTIANTLPITTRSSDNKKE